jgi:hypothetical protein
MSDKQTRGAETLLRRHRAEVQRRSMHLKGAAACNTTGIVVMQISGNEEVHLGKQECPDRQPAALAQDVFALCQWLPLTVLDSDAECDVYVARFV